MENFKEKLNGEQVPRETIINIILYMTILIMPLIVVNVSSPRYVLGKLMFLYVAGFFLLVNLILDHKIKFKKEHIIVLLFLATILVSCIFSPYKIIAFFGTKERSEGFVTIAIYILLFIASSEYLKVTEKSINLILTIVNIHATYGILQFYKFDPIQKWALGYIEVNDSIGLLGNRIFFSIYILFFLVFSTFAYIFKEKKIDLIILDIMMPVMDGLTALKKIREVSTVPVVLLTAKGQEEDKLQGYDYGADDYMTKPFSPNVLVAKVKALLKRTIENVDSSTQEFNGLSINKLSREVKVNGEVLSLSPKEYELLVYLIDNEGVALSRDTILDNVWGLDYYGDIRTVDTNVKRLREKLLDKSNYIVTVRGSGYKFEVK